MWLGTIVGTHSKFPFYFELIIIPKILLNFVNSYKINRSSDGKTLYMKVAQNDKTNPKMQPVRPPRVPSIANTQLSSSSSSFRKRETPGILSRLFPPFAGITSYCVRAHLAPLLIMSCIDMHLFALYSLFLSPLLSGRLRD